MVMLGSQQKELPVQEGLFSIPSEAEGMPYLIGSRCRTCGEAFFPAQRACANCCTETAENVFLSRRGKLFSYTNVNHPVPGGYKGKVPFGVGCVELPEGIRITSRLTEHDTSKLWVGMEVELVLEALFADENNNAVIGFAFKPIESPTGGHRHA